MLVQNASSISLADGSPRFHWWIQNVRLRIITELSMMWTSRAASLIGVAILASLFAASTSAAQQCQTSGDCRLPLACLPGLFSGYCGVQACNADTDCRNGSACDFGVCQTTCARNTDCDPGQICVRGESHRVCEARPASSGGGGIVRYYTEGGVCGTIRLGGPTDTRHVKHIGCAPGLRCIAPPNGMGTCQRLPP